MGRTGVAAISEQLSATSSEVVTQRSLSIPGHSMLCMPAGCSAGAWMDAPALGTLLEQLFALTMWHDPSCQIAARR